MGFFGQGEAEAGRERRAKVINADGALQAVAKLAEVLMRYPVASSSAIADVARDGVGVNASRLCPSR